MKRLTTNVKGHFAFFADEILKLNFWIAFIYFLYLFCFFMGAFISSFDDQLKVIYAIECKNTASARAVHEIKTELDSYIGQDGKGGHILKHLNRHNWLNQNMEQMVKFVDNPGEYQLVSFVLSSNVIPVVYLAKNKAALPIVSFRDMVRNGFVEVVSHLED